MGHRWLLTALAIVWAADSGAYFAGRHFGGKVFKGRKLSPRISPNKTIEGLVGGLVAGIATGMAFGWLAGATPAQLPALALGAVATVLFSVRSEERRVGNECVSKCRSRWLPYN